MDQDSKSKKGNSTKRRRKAATPMRKKPGFAKPKIGDIIRDGLLAGQDPKTIVAEVKKHFPNAKTTTGSVNNYRSTLRKEGIEVETVRTTRAKRGRKKAGRPKARKRNITMVLREALLAGKTNDEALEAVKAEFPQAKTGRTAVVIQRSKLRKEGRNIPTSREANKQAKVAQAPTMPAIQRSGRKTSPETTIAIACDHAGVALKQALKKALKDQGLTALDLGTDSADSVDYPDYATAVAQAMAWGQAARGIVICGSGIGISIAINRHRHVRAALCTSGLMARLARQHNDANVLALGSRLTGEDVALDCLSQFLNTKFEGGRHQRRIDKLS